MPGDSGLRLMPRKMAGIETMTMEPSTVAMTMASVVLDRATHWYAGPRRPRWFRGVPLSGPRPLCLSSPPCLPAQSPRVVAVTTT